MSRSSAAESRGGFVLAVVVFMLFAIAVAGAAGYLVVNTEFSMARHSSQGDEALTVARAGLHRFIAEQIGVVGDSVSYAIGDGVALVTSRKLFEQDSVNHVYYIRSEGSVQDVLAPGTPARRVVGAHAYHRKRPLAHHATLVVTADGAWAQNSGAEIDADDWSTTADCPGGGADNITGAIARVSTGDLNSGDLHGHPDGEAWSGGYAEIYDSIGLRWDVLSDPNFPVDFDGAPPVWASLPADSFPVVRYHGDFNGGSGWSGRGVFIVNGEFDAGSSFSWDGIVLAGEIDDILESNVRGIVVAGLDGPNPYPDVYWRGTIRYYSCFVYEANESLSYLEIIENSVFEAS